MFACLVYAQSSCDLKETRKIYHLKIYPRRKRFESACVGRPTLIGYKMVTSHLGFTNSFDRTNHVVTRESHVSLRPNRKPVPLFVCHLLSRTPQHRGEILVRLSRIYIETHERSRNTDLHCFNQNHRHRHTPNQPLQARHAIILSGLEI